MASVRVIDLQKRFGDVEALKGLNFSVDDGDFFCLLGPPGAGKTTTLRIISGLEKAEEGSVWLGDEMVDEIHPKDRDVAMVFEDLALYPHWTAYQNMAHPLKLRKTPEQEIQPKIQEVATMLRIDHILDRRPGTFSGGERRRLAIGRALVRQPRVLLLDEPLTDLDAKIRQEMTAELKRLQTDIGQTMIYATHDFEEAMGMADEILVLNLGVEEQTGAPDAVYEQPLNSFVARFVGSPAMNLIECSALAENGDLVLEHPTFRISQVAEADLPRKVLLGIRPEDVELVETPGITARVDIVQVLGDEQIVDLSLGNGTVIKWVCSIERALSGGSDLAIRFPGERLFLFNADTGEYLRGPGL